MLIVPYKLNSICLNFQHFSGGEIEREREKKYYEKGMKNLNAGTDGCSELFLKTLYMASCRSDFHKEFTCCACKRLQQ